MISGICGEGIAFTADPFRITYICIAILMWICTGIFSRDYFKENKKHIVRYVIFTALTLLSVCGVFLAADMFTMFIFFEIMSFTSFVWVAHDEKEASMQAAYTYLAIAIIGGMCTLMGMWMTCGDGVSVSLTHGNGVNDVAGAVAQGTHVNGLAAALLAVGFAAKAGVWPLHIWLPKAHPVAPAPASALLSGMLTKTGIFGLIFITCKIVLTDTSAFTQGADAAANAFTQGTDAAAYTGSTGAGYAALAWGEVWMALGLVTMFTGALLAVFSIDLKRTLACSSLSQIGFIVTGIATFTLLQGGEETNHAAAAACGTVLHMVNHSLIKLVLFLVAGVIYMNTHRLDLNDIRGYGRHKPLLMVLYIIGAASISGIPGTSGYISKTLLHESIDACGAMFRNGGNAAGALRFEIYGWSFLICGGMTLAYMLKLFMVIFVEKRDESDDGRSAASNISPDVNTGYSRKAHASRYISAPGACSIIIPALILLAMGFIPQLSMRGIASAAAGFWGISVDMAVAETPGASLLYGWTSLRGALISVCIGCLIYLGVIRTLLISNGKYLDRWPKWLDLEKYLYRPVIERFLPVVLGFIAAIVSQVTDFIIVCARRTTHSQTTTRINTGSMDHRLAVVTGQALDRIAPKKDGPESHIPALIEKEERLNLTQRFISGSLSFGLILVCIGLILVLIYTLVTS